MTFKPHIIPALDGSTLKRFGLPKIKDLLLSLSYHAQYCLLQGITSDLCTTQSPTPVKVIGTWETWRACVKFASVLEGV